MSRTTRVVRRLRALAIGSAISLVPLVAPATEMAVSPGDLLVSQESSSGARDDDGLVSQESSSGTTGDDPVPSYQPIAPAEIRKCFIDAAGQTCEGTGRRVAGFPDVVWNLTPNASPGSSDLTSTGAVDLLKEFVRTHPDTFPLTDAEDFVDLEVVRIKPHAGSSDEPESALIRFRQLYSGFEILDGRINMDVVEGTLRTVAGTVLSRTRVAAAMDRELRKARVDYRVAAAEIVARYGLSAVEAYEGEEAVLDVAEGRLVYTVYSGGTVYHVDAVTAETVRSVSTVMNQGGFAPTGVPILTGAEGAYLSGHVSPDAWLPLVSFNSNTNWWTPDTLNRSSGETKVDAADSGVDCLFLMSHDIDAALESEPPYPTLWPGEGSMPRWGFDDCTNPTVFSQATPRELSEQFAYDRIYLAADIVAHDADAMFWAEYPPDDRDPLRVTTWSEWDNSVCNGNQGEYYRDDEEICLNVGGLYSTVFGTILLYNSYVTPLHEFGHYIADSYDFANGGSCDEKAASEGLADTMTFLFEHYRYTGGGENLSTDEQRTLFLNGPGEAMTRSGNEVRATTEDQLIDVDDTCIDSSPHAKGMVIAQVMWKLINNMMCDYDANGDCGWNQTRKIGPDGLPKWSRRYFTRAMDLLQSDVDTETFLLTIYVNMLGNKRDFFLTYQWDRFRDAFEQNGVDLCWIYSTTWGEFCWPYL